MPGRAGTYAPAPAPAPLQPEEFPQPRTDTVPGRRSRPLLPVAPAPRWSGISFSSLLLHRHSLAVLSPHVAGLSRESAAYMSQVAAEEVVRVLRNEPPRNLINPQADAAYRARRAALDLKS